MYIDTPKPEQLPQLRQLWQEAFGDSDAFLDGFFSAISLDACRCVTENGRVAAALYMLPCALEWEKLAYIYAVATAEAFRGRGLCRSLMENTHAWLKKEGYAGAILVPGSESLFIMYQNMGYRLCSHVSEFTCRAGDTPCTLKALSLEEYAQLRRSYLPEGGVVQEGKSLAFLQTYCQFYAGEDVLLACSKQENTLQTAELLGNAEKAPEILAALDCREGSFRTPGQGKPFAMYLPFAPIGEPQYFGLAFD